MRHIFYDNFRPLFDVAHESIFFARIIPLSFTIKIDTSVLTNYSPHSIDIGDDNVPPLREVMYFALFSQI